MALCSCEVFVGASNRGVKPNPDGTKLEKIQYHKKEIKKYKSSIAKEDQNINKALADHHMNEARQAYSRKDLYVRKIQEHINAIDLLEKE